MDARTEEIRARVAFYPPGSNCDYCYGSEHYAEDVPYLLTELTALREEIERLKDELERDRSLVASGVTAVKKELHAWDWLTEGRGSYEWDDDRYQKEFGYAIEHVRKTLAPLERVAANLTNREGMTDEQIDTARLAALSPSPTQQEQKQD